MTQDEFRRFGHELIDWIADYGEHIRDYPVMTMMEPGDLVRALPASAPEQGESMRAVLDDFYRLVLPAVTHWNHPRFYGYFPNSATGPGILGELLAAALNVNGIGWKSSPAVSELEEVTLDWLRQWLGLPAEYFGIIYDTASVSSFHAIAAAREAACGSGRRTGDYQDLRLYCSEHAHSSIEKSAVAAGIGQDNVRKIGADEDFRMRADLLDEAIHADLAAGRKPFCIVATGGTTSMASVDPIGAIAEIANRHGAWLHVDGAYGCAAAIVPSMRPFFAGWERADSIVVNPHKWLLAPVDLSAFYTRRPEALRQAFSLVPVYLRTEQDSQVVNRMDYSVALGRRFRALKLWFAMRSHGREEMAAVIEDHIRYAAEFARWVREDERFEICAPVLFSLVCFRLKGSDEENQKLLDWINRSGKAFLTPTVFGGRFILRMAIGNYRTTLEDVRGLWDLIQQYLTSPKLS